MGVILKIEFWAKMLLSVMVVYPFLTIVQTKNSYQNCGWKDLFRDLNFTNFPGICPVLPWGDVLILPTHGYQC